MQATEFDLGVVGAGIIGMSCAWAAAKRGLKVVVIERDACARGASVRNFGFVTVTGQDRDQVWERARRTRALWAEVAARAGIPIAQRGSMVVAQRREASAVLEAFMETDMAAGCELLRPAAARERCPELATRGLQSLLWSPHELRVESREAIPKLAAWLERDLGVSFRWQTAVHGVDPPRLETSRGAVLADAVVVCPGDELVALYPERLAAAGVGRCTLQMLRLESPGFAWPAALMSDLSLVRYGGFARLPAAAVLRARLEAEQGEYLRQGIHLIVAQSLDGSLVVGDSHDYDSSAVPFAGERIDQLILAEYQAATGRTAPAVRERWTGSYASAGGGAVLIDAPAKAVRLVLVTSGIGASTGFAIGEDVIAALYL